ncbi:MAG: hypothetical protein ACKOE6_03735 [Flammeovirgaceae bacterium]
MRRLLTFLALLALAGAFVFLLEGCGDNPNPCKGSDPISADFSIGGLLYAPDTVLVADTILSGGTIVFESLSKREYDSYEWKIGRDPKVFTTKKVALVFQDKLLQPQTITIKLKVRDSFSGKCFPKSGATDSLTKQFVLMPETSSVVFGDYEGYLVEDPTKKFVVSVYYCAPLQHAEVCTNNIDRGCNNKLRISSTLPYIYDISISYRQLFIGDPRDPNFLLDIVTNTPGIYCNDPIGWLYFGKSINDVFIDYTTAVFPDNKKRFPHRFIGKRIK